jgi:hypothetical protein
MQISAKQCRVSAMLNGCNESTIYNKSMLFDSFRSRNAEILKAERGAGFWIWKPQIILQELKQCNADDIVIYTDAGVEFINNAQHLVNAMDDFCMLFGGQYNHHEWCKCDVLQPDHIGRKQLQASAMIFKACPESVEFLNEWLNLCQVPGFIDDSPSVKPNHPDFSEHRHDQALLTTLQLSQGIKSHYWPANYLEGKFEYPRLDYKDKYPVIFHHHRKRNDEWV